MATKKNITVNGVLTPVWQTDATAQQIDDAVVAAQNAVLYTAQSKTAAEQAQARNNISAMQGIESTDHPGCNYVLNGSTVEWVNPPMQLGVEYRTTERYLGKPVYVKAVECGGVPVNSTKVVSFDPSYNAVSTGSTFRALCALGVTSSHWTLPALIYGYGLDRSINIGGYLNGILIGTTETGASDNTVTVVVKYIKTTD